MGCSLAQMSPFLIVVGFIGLVIGWLLRGGCKQKILVNDRNWDMKLTDINNRLEKKAKKITEEKDNGLKKKNKEISALQSKIETLQNKANRLDADWSEKYTKLKSGYDLLLIENKGCESSMQNQKSECDSKLEALNEELEKTTEELKASKSKLHQLKTYLLSSQKNGVHVDTSPTPQLLKEPKDGKKDNLTLIKGIGKVLEERLNTLGIFHFDQIASWTQTQTDWMDKKMSFPGRIGREKWIEQAKKLANGVETEFSKRVRDGEVPSSKKV